MIKKIRGMGLWAVLFFTVKGLIYLSLPVIISCVQTNWTPENMNIPWPTNEMDTLHEQSHTVGGEVSS
jgi:hypothetical protein